MLIIETDLKHNYRYVHVKHNHILGKSLAIIAAHEIVSICEKSYAILVTAYFIYIL